MPRAYADCTPYMRKMVFTIDDIKFLETITDHARLGAHINDASSETKSALERLRQTFASEFRDYIKETAQCQKPDEYDAKEPNQ